MKLFFALFFSATLGAWSLAAAEPAPAGVATPTAKKSMVEMGMSGAQLAQVYGRPAEVRPIKVDDPKVKAEQWFYRRKVGETRIQTGDGIASRPAFSPGIGDPSRLVEIPEVTYRLKRVVTYQVTAVLLVNDQVSRARQWTEKTEEYAD